MEFIPVSVARESMSLSCGFTRVDEHLPRGSESRRGARRLIVRVLSNCGFRPVETRIEAICPFAVVPRGEYEQRDEEEDEKRGRLASNGGSMHTRACVHRDNRLCTPTCRPQRNAYT